MDHVKITEFTTETFKNLNPKARIEIMNSKIWSGQVAKLTPLKLEELTFDNVTIKTSISKQFINIKANRVFIKNCILESFKTGKAKQ